MLLELWQYFSRDGLVVVRKPLAFRRSGVPGAARMGFWDRVHPRIEISAAQKGRAVLERYVALHSQKASLADWFATRSTSPTALWSRTSCCVRR